LLFLDVAKLWLDAEVIVASLLYPELLQVISLGLGEDEFMFLYSEFSCYEFLEFIGI